MIREYESSWKHCMKFFTPYTMGKCPDCERFKHFLKIAQKIADSACIGKKRLATAKLTKSSRTMGSLTNVQPGKNCPNHYWLKWCMCMVHVY